MKRVIVVFLIASSLGYGKPSPKKIVTKIHHVLKISGEVALIAGVGAIWILSQNH